MNPFMSRSLQRVRSKLGEVFVSGTVSALTAFPLSIGFALLAGVPPFVMVLASVYSALFNAALGGRYGVGGPNTAVAMLTGAALMPFAPAESSLYMGYVFALCVLVGVYQLVFTLILRKVDLMDYVSTTVIDGITVGIGAVFVLTSLWMAAGLAQPGGAQWTLFHALMNVDRVLEGSANPLALLVAGITLAVGMLCWRFVRLKRFAILVGLVAGYLSAQIFGQGAKLEYVGWVSMPLFTTSLPDFRQVSWPVIFSLAGGPALAIALVGMLQTLSIAKAIRDPDEPYRPSREMLSQGLQHVFMGFFSGAPVSNSFNKSALKRDLGGGRSSQVFSAVVTVAMIYLAGGLVADIPMSALGGALILIGIGMLNLKKYGHHLNSGALNRILFFLPAAMVVVMDIQSALLIGIGLSLLAHFWKVSRPNVRIEERIARDGRHVSVITIDGNLFFGSLRFVERMLASAGDPSERNILLLRIDHLTYLDVPGAVLLAEEALRRRKRGDEIYVYATRKGIIDTLDKAGALAVLGEASLIHRDRDHPMKELLYPERQAASGAEPVERIKQTSGGESIELLAKRLRTTGNLGPLTIDQIVALLNQSKMLTARAGDIILKESDSMRDHLLLLEGKLEAQRIWSVLGNNDRSHTWGLIPAETESGFVFLGAASRVRARAITDIRYLLINAEKVDELVGWSQQFSKELEDDPELRRRMALIKHVKIFHHVPLENVITAFRKMIPIEVQAGQTIITQGDEGDSYYLIDSGDAEIVRTDPFTDETSHVATIGPGDAFGEEALLQGGYRNATINMITPGRLLMLGKANFDELLKPSVVSEVSPEEAVEMVSSGKARWLDCRYDMEYAESRIPSALFAPLDKIRLNVQNLNPDETYVVYCRSGRRSKAAVFLLRERHINAVSLSGGIKGWPYEVDVAPLTSTAVSLPAAQSI